MPIADAVPNIVSARFRRWLTFSSIFMARTNMQWSASLSESGDRVTIPIIDASTVTVSNRTFTKPGSEATPPDDLKVTYSAPSLNTTEMILNQSDWFAIKLHDIFRQQLRPALLDEAVRVAAIKMSQEVDTHVCEAVVSADLTAPTAKGGVSAGGGLTAAVGSWLGHVGVDLDTAANVAIAFQKISRLLVLANNQMDRAEVPREGRWIVTVPEVISIVELQQAYNGNIYGFQSAPAPVSGRFAGMWHGFDIYVTTNPTDRMHVTGTVSSATVHGCSMIFGNDYALAFGMVIDKVERLRLQDEFADAIRGMNYYGMIGIESTMRAAGVGISSLS